MKSMEARWQVSIVPARTDNYIFFLTNLVTKEAVLIDPADHSIASLFLSSQDLKLVAIFCTHHHHDHIDGVAQLQSVFSCPIYVSEHNKKLNRIPGQTTPLIANQTILVADLLLHVLDLSAHTMGHLGFYCEELNALFCGDTLFSLGCGRLFEGTGKHLYQSLKNLCQVPQTTLIYCAHEYTFQNMRFLKHFQLLTPDELLQAQIEINQRQKDWQRTIPTTLDFELRYNPYLKALNLPTEKSCTDQLIHLRASKDGFSSSV